MTDRRTVDDLLTEWNDDLLAEMSSGELRQTCDEYFDLYSRKFWPEHVGKFRRPSFAMEGRDREGGYYNPERNLIVINTDVANDDDALRSVLVHEMIHYYDSMVNDRRGGRRGDWHDGYFQTTMAEINRVEGRDFVRKNWLRDQMGKAEKPFYVYLAKLGDEFYAAFQATKRDQGLIYYGLGTILKNYRGEHAFETLSAYVAPSTDGRLHRLPRIASLSSSRRTVSFYEVSKSKNAELYDAVVQLAVPQNQVGLQPERPEEKQETFYLYLSKITDDAPERALYAYFWSPRRDPKLFPKVVEMLDYYHVKAQQPRAWVVPATAAKLKKGISSTNTGTKFKYARNMAVEQPYDDEVLVGGELRKLLPLLTSENEIDLGAARREIERKQHDFYAYLLVKDGGRTVLGFSSPKPVDALAQNIARYYRADSLHRLDDPNNVLLRKLPKVPTSNFSGATLGVLTDRGEGNAYYAAVIQPLLSQAKNILNESGDEVIPVGECFSYANRLAMKLGDTPNTFVVHATVHPSWHPRRYAHAWVETPNRVFDWQTATFPTHKYHRTGWPRQLFYEEFHPEDVKRYAPEEAIILMLRHRHNGPWDEDPGEVKHKKS